MNLNLSNKTFIISGSGRGLGLKMAETLLSEGSNVVISSRNKNRINKQFRKLKSKFNSKVACVHGDITERSILQKIKKIVKKNILFIFLSR